MVLTETAEQLRDSIKAEAHWQVVVHPTAFRQERIPTLSRAEKIMERCSVNLRGWDYPHIDQENRSYGPDWISSWCDFRGKREYWKFYQSGQFVHLFAFSEDSRPNALENALQKVRRVRPEAQASGVIDVVEMVYRTTEIFEFCSRLAQAIALDSPMSVKISLMGINGRLLTKQNAPFWSNPNYSSQPYLEYAREFPVDELVGDSAKLAMDTAGWFFGRFGWLNSLGSRLNDDQQRLLTRCL